MLLWSAHRIKFLAIRQQKFIWSLKEELSGVRPKTVVMSKWMLGLRIWHDWSHESQKGLVVWHFQNVCVKWSFSSRQKIQFSSSLTPIFCRKLLVGKRLCKNLKLKSISFELIVQVFAAWKAFFQLTFLSVEEQMS